MVHLVQVKLGDVSKSITMGGATAIPVDLRSVSEKSKPSPPKHNET